MAYGAIYRKALNLSSRVKARLAVLLGVTLVTAACVRHVAALSVGRPALPADDRIVISGYANLREFSRAEEATVKEGLGARFWTLVHWTNWRVTFWATRDHQANVAHEIVSELRAGRLVQLLVTNWPKPELNHTVVAFESRDRGAFVDFVVWDPNEQIGRASCRERVKRY